MHSLRDTLDRRLTPDDIRQICHRAVGNNEKEELFSLISDADDRISYNALWVFTHFPTEGIRWLTRKRDTLIDMLHGCRHTGKRRLILTLLNLLPSDGSDFRSDYLDYCLSTIMSSEPSGIRALCIKQAYAQCRHHRPLLHELIGALDMARNDMTTPAVIAARKNVLASIHKQTDNQI